MKELVISEIVRQMLPYLDNAQLERLMEVLQHCLWSVEVADIPDGVKLEWRAVVRRLLGIMSLR